MTIVHFDGGVGSASESSNMSDLFKGADIVDLR